MSVLSVLLIKECAANRSKQYALRPGEGGGGLVGQFQRHVVGGGVNHLVGARGAAASDAGLAASANAYKVIVQATRVWITQYGTPLLSFATWFVYVRVSAATIPTQGVFPGWASARHWAVAAVAFLASACLTDMRVWSYLLLSLSLSALARRSRAISRAAPSIIGATSGCLST